jgi:ankyrin repeat protein
MSAKSQQQFHDFEQTFYCLVNNEANPSSRDSKGYTPLHYAAMLDNYGGAYLLLTHNPKLKDVILVYFNKKHISMKEKFLFYFN